MLAVLHKITITFKNGKKWWELLGVLIIDIWRQLSKLRIFIQIYFHKVTLSSWGYVFIRSETTL